MDIHYITETQQRDRLFMQQYIHSFQADSKVLVVLEAFGEAARDTRFVVRRLSTLLSETMVYNNGFTGDQRNLVSCDENGKLHLRTDMIQQLIAPLQALLLGCMASTPDGAKQVSGLDLVNALRETMEVTSVKVFPFNPLSPLSNQHHMIQSEADTASLRKLYDEESPVLDLAVSLAPVRLAGPHVKG